MTINQGDGPDIGPSEQIDRNLEGSFGVVEERVRKLLNSSNMFPRGVGNPSLNSENFTYAMNLCCALITKIVEDLFKNIGISIEIPSIRIGDITSYHYKDTQIHINPETEKEMHGEIGLFGVIAHEYGHSIIHYLQKRGCVGAIPVQKQEEFCDIFSGYCIAELGKNYGIEEHMDLINYQMSIGYFGWMGEVSVLRASLQNEKLKESTHGDGMQRSKRISDGYIKGKVAILDLLFEMMNTPKDYTSTSQAEFHDQQ